MRSDLAIAVFGVGLSARDACSVESALEFFNYGVPVAAGCVERLTQQATDWCQGYLSIDPVTVYLSTVTPDTPWLTIMETSSTETTTTRKTTTTTQTTVTATTSTTTVGLTLTSTTILTSTSNPPTKRGLKARAAPKCGGPVCIDSSVSCIDLTEPNLARRPAARMSEACRCLLPPPTTVTLAATTAAVSTSTTTDIVEVTEVETDISVETDVSTAVVTEEATVTSTTIATETVPAACLMPYNSMSIASGNLNAVVVSNVPNALECCRQCVAKLNCVISSYVAPTCYHYLVAAATGGETSAQCPLGFITSYSGTLGDTGGVFLGPCS